MKGHRFELERVQKQSALEVLPSHIIAILRNVISTTHG